LNLVITDDLNLCKNNYYYALTSESVPIPPPNILPSHTGIADSGANDIYFAPDAPVTNYNPQAPTVGVRVANGRPERLVASATLASIPSLPQASMTEHVMPAFPHTLIGLGPFADLGCRIVFTKTSVTVYHPDGYPILSGWRDETGPRLWHFPLTTEAAQVALENASPQPHTCPRRRVTFSLPPSHIDKDSTVWRRGCPPNERTTYRSDPLPARSPSPTITPLAGHPHPSHGILATSTAGAACSVYYIYGAAQAVALAA
jgi:hypothetical protein